MTLGVLKIELKKFGIRQVGTMRISASDKGSGPVTIYFSSDQNIVVPFRLKNIYPLVLPSEDEDEKVHSEKIKALKRSLIPEWDEP